jgi:retinol-binding protein 3
MFPAGNGIAAFIPTGRAINPVTNTNWEGVGVKPDLETSAEDALNKALELAKPKPKLS